MVVAYLDAVLAALPDDWRPDHQDASTARGGFSMAWNFPPAWPYGVGVLWDGNLGWRYLEGGLHMPPAPLVDELVPYPELVAVVIGRLLNDGPATFPIIGATRWPHGDALITELDITT
jgi:hypothetical protein